MFNHLKSLTRLKVTTSRIENFSIGSAPIKSAAFRGLDSLKRLWLSLPNLNEHTFRNINNNTRGDISDTLTELMLCENDFTEVYDHMFIQFLKLQKLSFRSNRIRIISSKALNGLELWREIDLSQNRINELDHNTFQSLTYLSKINMGKNRMEYLADYLFKGLKLLKKLKLNKNRLKTMGCNVFDPTDFINIGGHPG